MDVADGFWFELGRWGARGALWFVSYVVFGWIYLRGLERAGRRKRDRSKQGEQP